MLVGIYFHGLYFTSFDFKSPCDFSWNILRNLNDQPFLYIFQADGEGDGDVLPGLRGGQPEGARRRAPRERAHAAQAAGEGALAAAAAQHALRGRQPGKDD